MAKRYRQHLLENDQNKCDTFFVRDGNEFNFAFWQRGGGFDCNLWSAKAIHDSIRDIEANPVRKKLVGNVEEWPWSSAYARAYQKGVIPDSCALPVEMPDPQRQRGGVV
jgi:hypothetical protein